MRRWFAIGLVGVASLAALGMPALVNDSVAETKDWHYSKVNITGTRGTNLILDHGSTQGVFVGSTGMIYVGASEEFLTDGKDKIRFEVVSVTANSSEAKIVQGTLSPAQLNANRRAVLRAKNAADPQSASSTPQTSAPSTGAGDVSKPRAPKEHTSQAWCTDRGSCARFCKGSSADSAAVVEMIKKHGLPAPSSMVDAAVAIQPALEKLGCAPDKSADARTASKQCGIEFTRGKGGRSVLPGVVPGLAQAAIEAKKKGYVLVIGSTYRSLEEQVDMMCDNYAKGGAPCGVKETGLSCPGPNVHTDGFAVDLHLERNGKKLTPAKGTGKPCAERTALVKQSKELMDLNDIMFASGWWKFCEELWHFEYTENAYNSKRTKTY